MLKDKISEEIKNALKQKNEVRLSTMRMLLSALNYAQIDKMRELTPDEELDVVKKEAKKRTDAIESYTLANKNDLVEAEKAELAILQEYLPQAMSREEVESIVNEVINGGNREFGLVMKEVMAKTKGTADGKTVSEIVRAKLQA